MKKLILSLSAALMMGSHLEASAQNYAANNPVATTYQPIETFVYPNPAINSTTILLNYTPMRRVIVDIVDFNGTLRRSYAFAPGGNRFTVDVGFLERGYYVLRVRDGAALVSRTKLIKG